MFLTKPEILKSGKREISYDKLLEFQSFDEATEYVIEKETEGVLRDSHAEQIRKLSEFLGGTPLTNDLPIWPEFIEICERRNILVHNDGVVSSQYIDVCKKHGAQVSDLKRGDSLTVDPKYLRRAVYVIGEMAFKLLQVCWRKLDPKSLDDADTAIINFQFEAIRRRHPELACVVSEFALKYVKKWATDRNKLSATVNAANAFKKAKKLERSEQIISEVDWSATSEEFQVSIAGVSNDVDKVADLMRRIGANNKTMTVAAYRDWPVFDDIRSDVKFCEAFESVFGEPIFIADESEGVQSANNEPIEGMDIEAE